MCMCYHQLHIDCCAHSAFCPGFRPHPKMKTYFTITASIVSAAVILIIIVLGTIWTIGAIGRASPASQWLARETEAQAECDAARVKRIADYGCRIRACGTEGINFYDYHKAGAFSQTVRDARLAYSRGDLSYEQLCQTVRDYWQKTTS